MIRTIFGLMTAIVMACPTVVSAHDFEEVNDYGMTIYYNILSDNTVEVTNNNGNNYSYEGDLVIPESVIHDGVKYTVTELGDSAFIYCRLTSIDIPETVTRFGVDCFRSNKLTEITIPASVTILDDSALRQATLETVTFEEGSQLTTIGQHAFRLTKIKEIDIPETVTTIGAYAFYNIEPLVAITFPEKVTEIPNQVCYKCYALKDVVLPKGVTDVDKEAFRYCTALESFTSLNPYPPTLGTNVFLNDTLSNCTLYVPYGAYLDYYTATGWSGFKEIVELDKVDSGDDFTVDGISYAITSLEWAEVEVVANSSSPYSGNITIPETITYNYIKYSVTGISDGAFKDCTSLIEVTIPATVSEIGEEAFSECTALEKVFSLNTTPATLGENVFENVLSSCWLIVPTDAKEAYASAEQWSEFTTLMGLTPLVATSEDVTDVTSYTATLSATYEAGYYETIGQGFEYWTSDIDIDTIEGTIADEQMTATLTDLQGGTTYSYRAFAKTENTIVYGETYTFMTVHVPPTVTTADVSELKSTSAVLNGNVEHGTEEVLEQGFKYWAKGGDEQTVAVDSDENGDISVKLSDLTYNVEYTFYVFVTTATDTYCGEEATFLTPTDAPTVTTLEATNVTATSALLQGYASKGSEEIISQGFEYWIDGGNVETIEQTDPVMACTVSGLTPGTTYVYHVFATTASGSTYGEDMEFTTLTPTGISSINFDFENVEDIYTTDGQLLNAPQKGINILRLTDGTVKKIYVK